MAPWTPSLPRTTPPERTPRHENGPSTVRFHRRLRLGDHQGELVLTRLRREPAPASVGLRLQFRLPAVYPLGPVAGRASQLVLLRLRSEEFAVSLAALTPLAARRADQPAPLPPLALQVRQGATEVPRLL